MLQFAKNTYLPNLNNIHLLWETNFVSLGTQRLNLNLSLCSYLGNNATLADSADRLVEHCMHSKAGGNEFNGPFAWSSHGEQKTPCCKANNAMVPWKERILANFEWSDFFVFLVSLYCLPFSKLSVFVPCGCFVSYSGDIVINFRTCICCFILDKITPWFLWRLVFMIENKKV